MKTARKLPLLLPLLLLFLLLPFEAQAYAVDDGFSSTYTYNYDYWDEIRESPDAYRVDEKIYFSQMGLAKDVKKRGENAKVAIRNIRRDAIEHFKKLKGSDDISEDEIKELEDDAQKLTDKFVKMIDEDVAEKSKEIMTV